MDSSVSKHSFESSGLLTRTRDLDEEDLKFREAERLIHDATESGKSANEKCQYQYCGACNALEDCLPIRHGRQESIDHAEPELRIPERLTDLRPGPLDAGNITASLVLEDTGSSVYRSASISRLCGIGMDVDRTYAMRFSSLLIHLTSFGLPSNPKQMSASRMVEAPKKSEIHRQGASPPYFSAWEPIPYMTKLAMMPKPALADCQNRAREECSSRLYHDPTTRTKPGEMVHSKKPWRARIAMSWDQF
ncbi:hypothetical protein MPH_07920 [Macrophomina phaseolina MS6]|uniref:Uncharacterized protein n=1 Tax=Macrophomina phaseolina (strain MS6) TaxID=1126212 RepID=K2SDD7_MACPH|nr:hypothetical protein MPH_07920 [Macrophomina phaseolina MS6]